MASRSLADLRAERAEEIPEQSQTTWTPSRTALLQPYPNPFNPRVEIPVELASSTRVELAILDVRGRLVRTLLREARPAGRHHLVWMADDDQGRAVASGVYYARLLAGEYRATQTLTLIR